VRKMRSSHILGLIGLAIFGVFILGPLYITIITAIKNINDVFTIPPKLIPYADFQPSSEAFDFIFNTRGKYTFVTSLIVASTATAIALIPSLLAAYGFSRYPKAAMNDERSFFTMLTLRMVPPFAVVLPIFLYWNQLGLFDTYPSLIWTYTVFSIPLAIWLLKGFVDDVSPSIEDAAKVDGYGFLDRLRRYIIPILGPALAATIALVWLFLWNEFLFALKLGGSRIVTYTAYLPQLRVGQRVQWNVLGAIGVLGAIPPLIILILFRKYLIRVYLGR
jgi:multiple sugar transport system permease protein